MPDTLPLYADALLLDMDGTLVDSGQSVVRCWNRLFAEYGVERSFGHDLHGQPARTVLREVMPELDEDGRAAAARRIEQMEIEDAASLEILPGTERLLAELDQAARTLGRPTWTIVTSCTDALFAARWERSGLPTPPLLVTADQVTHGKPDPEPYRLGAERLGVEAARALVVEDSVGGLQSGRAAGCGCLALTTTTPAADLEPLSDAIATSLADLAIDVMDGALRISRRGA